MDRRRVKVYELLEEGSDKWREVGTGHCSLDYVESERATCLVVKSEDDGSTLLRSRILKPGSYGLQQSSLIVWKEGERDMALSFQASEGCQDVWAQIADVQTRQYGTSDAAQADAEDDDVAGAAIEDQTSPAKPRVLKTELSKPTLGTVGEFETALSENAAVPALRQLLAQRVLEENYLEDLKSVFADAEDLEDTASLHVLHRVFRTLVLLNMPPLCDRLFRDEYIMTLIGALEYDPDFPDKRTRHREYLENTCSFKQVVPLSNPEVTSKIHQTFRLQYLKDVVLPRVLDDGTFTTINSYIFFNYVEIVDRLQKDTSFLTQIFALVRDKEIVTEQQKDTIFFLQEFSDVAKTLQEAQRSQFYTTLCKHGLLDIFARSINHEDVKLRLASTEILACLLDFKTSLLRSYLLEQQTALERQPEPGQPPRPDPGSLLLRQLIRRIHEDEDEGMKAQFTEILKVMLENEPTDEDAAERDAFIGVFYEKYVSLLFENIRTLPQESAVWPQEMLESDWRADGTTAVLEFDASTQALVALQLELISFFIRRHTFRIKYLTLNNHFASKVMVLLRSPHKHIALGALRVLRTFVGTKDEFYLRYIIKHNMFVPVFCLFREHEHRDNLINSAVLELIEFIRLENLKNMIKYIVERFRTFFAHVKYVKTFELLVLKYEQITEVPSNGASATAAAVEDSRGVKRGRERGLDEDEEAYFNDDDDDDTDGGNGTPTSAREADDDELRPRPPERRSMSPPLMGNPGSPGKSPSSSPRSRSPPLIVIGNKHSVGSPRTVRLVDYDGDDDEHAASMPGVSAGTDGDEHAAKRSRLK